MNSGWIFVRMILNSYSNSLLYSFVSKFTTVWSFYAYTNYFFEYAIYSSIDKSRDAHLWVDCVTTVDLSVEIMAFLSMISYWIFVRINLNAYLIVSIALLFQSSAINFFWVCEPFFSLTTVGPPIYEWAVPRPFVRLRVEIMVLLSMISDWIFVRINLNAYSDSLSHFCFKVHHYIFGFSSL